MTDGATNAKKAVLYYTPVTKELRKMAQQLGDYMHATRYREPDDPWWAELRDLLEKAYAELERANVGVLVGPPLLHGETGTITMNREVLAHEEPEAVRAEIDEVGGTAKMRVRHLKSVPTPRL